MNREWDDAHNKVFEWSLKEIYRDLFDEGGIAVDVGCWHGFHSRWLATYAERVYAFDPFNALTTKNNVHNVCYIQKALSDFKSRKPLNKACLIIFI